MVHSGMSDALDNAGLAKLFGVTTRTVTELCRRRVIIRRGKRFDRDEATLGYVRYLREVAAGRGQASGGGQAVSARARLAEAQAVAQETRNKITLGALISEADVEARGAISSYAPARRSYPWRHGWRPNCRTCLAMTPRRSIGRFVTL